MEKLTKVTNEFWIECIKEKKESFSQTEFETFEQGSYTDVHLTEEMWGWKSWNMKRTRLVRSGFCY